MASCTTVASRFWPLRSSGLHVTFPLRPAPPCWRPGANDYQACWRRSRSASLPWIALTWRRVSSWSLRSMRNMPPRSLDWQWGSTWVNHCHPTTRRDEKLESEDSRPSFSVTICSCTTIKCLHLALSSCHCSVRIYCFPSRLKMQKVQPNDGREGVRLCTIFHS